MTKNSYFVLVSDRIDYHIYLAISGLVNEDELLNLAIVWTVIHHVTRLNFIDFDIVPTSLGNFEDGLIKIDFRVKKK